MKGRLNTVVWRVVAFLVASLLLVFGLAYSAGARSGGLGLLDFGALPSGAGLRLLAAALVTVIMVLTLVWLASRLLTPTRQLADYSEQMLADEPPALPVITSEDDLAFIAENLARVSEQLAAARADQRELEELRRRLGELESSLAHMATGDLSASPEGAEAADVLGRVVAALNETLERVAAVLRRSRASGGMLGRMAPENVVEMQQAARLLGQQERELTIAASAAGQLGAAMQQVREDVQAAGEAAKSAAAGTAQASENMGAAQQATIRAHALLSAATPQAAQTKERAARMLAALAPLAAVTERAQLLALNAALEAARGAQAARTPAMFAEDFRELAQDSRHLALELGRLTKAIEEASGALLGSLEQSAAELAAGGKLAGQARESLAAAAAAVQEAGTRAGAILRQAAVAAEQGRASSAALNAGAELGRRSTQNLQQAVAAGGRLAGIVQELNATLAALRVADLAAQPAEPVADSTVRSQT